MKLSYYMRGLGTGIVVTALIMGIATRNTPPPALTDAEIRAAAEKLGMVESGSLTLSDLPSSTGSEDSDEPAKTPDKTAEPGDGGSEGNGEPEGSEEPGDSGSESIGEPEGSEEPGDSRSEGTGEPEGSAEPGDSESEDTGEPEIYTVTVKAGSGSRSICNQLEEKGLIEDAGEFDRYLINNGYSKRISVGTYEIKAGADWESIAKIITKSR